MEAPRKRRKLSFYPPQQSVLIVWNSPNNKEGKVTISATELGDGATSKVYLGEMDGKVVAVKSLKCIHHNMHPHLRHTKGCFYAST